MFNFDLKCQRDAKVIHIDYQTLDKYTTRPKVCGHLLVDHLIPKSWALIWSWSPLYCYTSLPHCCGDFHSATSISEVGYWCWAIRSGSQSTFLFIPKVFNGVDVRALCRPVKFFHTDLDKPFLYGPHFEHCHTETGKGLPQTVTPKLEAPNHLECHGML